ncbi:carotenoid biosynthesis protein [Nocardia australiensis]|uniref:carotenoid biosynthesis protein n=1 Tax=Nocardia australiensis TaxID=2887191 RepID=UPI001D154093|nr:carotenoid biosynthesis protein [Nocardia australiensis]
MFSRVWQAISAACMILLIAAQIGYPLSSGAARDRITVVVVLLSVATALAHAVVTRGAHYAAGFLAIVSGLGLLSEIVGTATGFPFGSYTYATDRLGPAIAGVPLVVALAWTGGLYPIWVVAGLSTRRAVVRIGLTAMGAVGWDLFLDPQMVTDGQWNWSDADSGLPGLAQIPYTNYLGWFAVAAVMALALTIWDRTAAHTGSTVVPVVVFLWTWLGSALAHAVFLGLPASARYGAVGLGILGIPLVVWLVQARHELGRQRFRPSCTHPSRRPGTM